jgi:hypothetical protein
MKKILLYGNCQTTALTRKLRDKNYFTQNIVAHRTRLLEAKFLKEIKSADIIITQPISDNFRNKEYLSTKYIIENKNEDTELIVFPSLHAGGVYYFDAADYFDRNDKRIQKPSVIHYGSMIKYYVGGKSVDEYINDVVSNVDFKSKDYLESYANERILELERRENEFIEKYSDVNFLRASSFVKENYKDNLLFFSQAHAQSHIYNYLLDEIKILLGDDNFSINYKSNPQLNQGRNILYKCIEKIVNFEYKDISFISRKVHGARAITEHYYRTYDKHKYTNEDFVKRH